jgi:type II secretory pathway component PulK
MRFFCKKALAIVNMLIFVIIFTSLAAAILALLSSHTRLLESSIRRLKAHYVAEAGSVAAFEALRKGNATSNLSVEWAFDPISGNPTNFHTATVSVGGGRINSTVDYTVNW